MFWILSGSDIVNNDVLLSEINLHGDTYCIINSFDNISKRFGNIAAKDFGPSVVLGPLNLVPEILKTSLYPGVYCNLENFKCTTYYPKYSKYLLNQSYFMLPMADLAKMKHDIFHGWLGWEYKDLFVRPNSGFKSFTGQVVKYETFESDINSLSCVHDYERELVLISRPKNILREWRFVIGDKNIITSSQYRSYRESPSGKIISIIEHKAGSPENVQNFVNSVISDIDWTPDRLYTMDVGEVDGTFKIIELNSFSCSGYYKCDMSKIVKYAREIIIDDYSDTIGVD